MDEKNTLKIYNAVNYIYSNFDKKLSVEQISEYCGFSKFYFNRMFRTVTGESVYSFIKRLKYEKAAAFIKRNSDISITEIASMIRYSSSNFSTEFRKIFGVSPYEFKNSSFINLSDSYERISKKIKDYKVDENSFRDIDKNFCYKKINSMKLYYKKHILNYGYSGEAWDIFCKEAENNNMVNKDTVFVGISYDDILISDENKCIYDTCITVKDSGYENILDIEEGNYACYYFYDSIDRFEKVYRDINSVWIPFGKYDIDFEKFIIEIYRSYIEPETGKIKCEICVPLK
ncbi:MAG TPA: AraC family transcriptional regulator [Tepiditoga sp.]|nr:AraC family transcriptional regulator [Tepiditoga sp.]